MFARIENNRVVEYPIANLRERLPNISLPEKVESAHLPPGYAYVHYTEPPQYNPESQSLSQGTPKRVGDEWFVQWDVKPLPPAHVKERRDLHARDVRTERDALLAQSDYTQLLDFPGNREAWAAYRKQLRDMPLQPGFPFSVKWPAKPV